MSHNKQPGQANQHTPQRGQEYGPVHQVQEREQHNRDRLGHEKHQSGQVNPNEQHTQPQVSKRRSKKTGITIFIDRIPCHSASASFNGAELRKLSVPPIGPDKHLFRVVSGNGDDIQIGDEDVITVNMREAHHGRHFFSDTIIPSKDAVARRAYFIYLKEGSQPGHDVEHWSKAEAQLKTHTHTKE